MYIEVVKKAIFMTKNCEKLGVDNPVNDIYKIDEIRIPFRSE